MKFSRLVSGFLVMSLVACGVAPASQNLISETSEIESDNSGAEFIADNMSAFGTTSILPMNLSENQKQNLALIVKFFTSAGLLETARRLGDNHVISKLRYELAAAEIEVQKARSLVSSDNRGAAISDVKGKIAEHKSTISTLQNQMNDLKEKIKTATDVEASAMRSTIAQAEQTISDLKSKIAVLDGNVTKLLNSGGVLSNAEVKAARESAMAMKKSVVQKLEFEITRLPGTGLRNAFRKTAFVGSAIFFVDAGLHIYAIHGLDLEPSIFPEAQMAQIIGAKAYNWLRGKSDKYLDSTDQNDYTNDVSDPVE